jgi:hypothetical protein
MASCGVAYSAGLSVAQQQQQQQQQQQDIESSGVLPASLPASYRELLTQYSSLQQQLNGVMQRSQPPQQPQSCQGELAERSLNIL